MPHVAHGDMERHTGVKQVGGASVSERVCFRNLDAISLFVTQIDTDMPSRRWTRDMG